MSEFDEIMVPVDGSEASHRAAQFALRLVSALNTPIRFAYVVPTTSESVMAMSRMSREEVEEIERKKARTIIDQARVAMGPSGANAGELIMIGDAAEEILNYMENHPNTMVVMGRRGLSRFQTLVLGSVSDKVMRYARGAVTLVT